jgi:hypothetical protein
MSEGRERRSSGIDSKKDLKIIKAKLRVVLIER